MQTKVMPKKVKPKLGKIREGIKKCLRPDLSTDITMRTLWHKVFFG